MKKLIVIAIIAIVALTAIACGRVETVVETKTNTLYPKTGAVTSIWKDDDVVTVMDCNGYLWDFCGIEDWQVGDTCSMIMDSNGTADIYDDTIVMVQYSSFTIKDFGW